MRAVHGECHSLRRSTLPHVTRKSFRTPDLLPTFRGRGLGTRLGYILGDTLHAELLHGTNTLTVSRARIKRTVWKLGYGNQRYSKGFLV